MSCFSRRACALLTIALHCAAPAARGQWQANTGPAAAAMGAVVGGDVERYIRSLILAGRAPMIAWGSRDLSPLAIQRLLRDTVLGPHPWAAALRRAVASRGALGGTVFVSANSAFAWGANDGAMWQGRGLTAAVGGGAVFTWGPLSAVAAPMLFSAQNASFPILRPPVTGVSPYADPQYPVEIDLPQRMGAGTYSRLDPGESFVRVSGAGVSVGFATASEGWGTGESFPSILGANAGGFPHAFFGTSKGGIRIPGLGRIAGRYMIGSLSQSAYSSVRGSETYVDADNPGTRRIATGLNVTLLPAVLPNLELGASRFFHSPYGAGQDRWSVWTRPFDDIFKKSLRSRSGPAGGPDVDADNQLGALYARWVLPQRGAEVSIEILREDHNWDSRDLAQEPENNSAIFASVRAVTQRRHNVLSTLTLEYFDGDVRPIAQSRAQGFLYVHGVLIQGHTLRGQLLGSPIGAGAVAGERIAWERFAPDGSLRFNVQRWRSRSRRTQDIQGAYPPANDGASTTRGHDWILDGSAMVSRSRGHHTRGLELGMAWAGAWQFGTARTNFYARASVTAF